MKSQIYKSNRRLYSSHSKKQRNSSNSLSSLPVIIDLMSRESKRELGASPANERNTRRKTDIEANYAAATVKDSLARAGIPYPEIKLETRIKFGEDGLDVDISRVDLVTSPEDADSPFALPFSPLKMESFTSKSYPALISSLIEASRGYYKLDSTVSQSTTKSSSEETTNGAVTPGGRTGSDWESSTSSITDSDESNTNPALTEETDQSDATTNLAFISMGEALSVSNYPRLIALSFSPFSVVHVDAAFSQMTGMSSAQVLGRPLHELLQDPIVSAALQTSCKSFSLKDLHHQSIKVKNQKGNGATYLPVKVLISPIGQESNSITHYSLELEQIEKKKPHSKAKMIEAETSTTATSSTHSRPMGMMG